MFSSKKTTLLSYNPKDSILLLETNKKLQLPQNVHISSANDLEYSVKEIDGYSMYVVKVLRHKPKEGLFLIKR